MDYEIDYKAMFEEQKKIAEEQLHMMSEFFELMNYLAENAQFMTPVTDNIMKLELADQLAYLRAVKKGIVIAKGIVKKYKLEVKEQEND